MHKLHRLRIPQSQRRKFLEKLIILPGEKKSASIRG